MMKPWFIGLALYFAFSCKPESEKSIEQLEAYLSGSFDSREQSLKDSSYYNIHLNVTPIWQERNYEGKWLYVEQAAASQLDQPYRQRVYHLTAGDPNEYISAIYLINDPIRFAGDYKLVSPLSDLTVDSLELKAGCEVILRKTETGFEGQTGLKTCKSELRGAAYATSKVKLTATELTSWDQGFDADGVQVWGAEKGPYIFKRRK